ncbi:MAG: chromosomal replication initiator protein DnaA [Syntrophus sp. (in: bacteria)]|nr:chromosomal replication initiator protein DnaA [Syntrophus sp. (in: bacteria)]
MEILWDKSTHIIKDKLSQQNFDTWIRPIRVASLEGNQVHLSVPNKFFKDWLMENYRPIITDALSSVAGVELKVDFMIGGDGAGIASPDLMPGRPPAASPKSSRVKTHTSLNQHYRFERFVVGASNQFAHAAAVSVAEQPAKNYNPLFIYGGVGLGKTHLLNAIGLHAVSLYPQMNVVYVSAEEFLNELVSSIRFDKMPKFRDKYRNIDYLLIDDIQFIAGKGKTEEEFFHTFNTLHDSGKQIVVTSDKFPKDIPNLEGRLRSRFEWGLIADIQQPEIETRIAIIEKKAQENKINLPKSVAHYIAVNAESNIRELEGFLIRIAAYSSLQEREIDMELAKEVLRKIIKQSEKEDITIDNIIKAVASTTGVKISDIKSPKKNKNIVLSRQIAMYLARNLTHASFPDIGEKIGGRDHSTIIYANNKIKKNMEMDVKLKNLIEEIEDVLKHHS